MIDPQSVKVSGLPSLPLAWKKGLPECSGIYFVVNTKDEILYIGRSLNIRSRWQKHHRYHQLEQLENTRIAWLELSDDFLLNEIEAALIEWFKPSFNGMVLEKDYETTKTSGGLRNKVRAFLDKRKITVYQFIKDTGIATATGYKLANNPNHLPSMTVLSTICDAYRVPPEQILEWIDPVKAINTAGAK